MSLRKLEEEKVCAKGTTVLSFPVEDLRDTYTRLFSSPFFHEVYRSILYNSIKNYKHFYNNMYLCYRERFHACLAWWWFPTSYLSPAQKQENLPGTQSHHVEDAAHSHMHTRLVLHNQNFPAAGLAMQQFLVLYYSFKAHSIAHGLLLHTQRLTLLQKQDNTPLFPHP